MGKYAHGRGGLLDRTDQWGSAPLVAVFIGGNDFLDGAQTIATGAGAPETVLPALVQNTLTSVLTAINGLAAAGVTDFLVPNLPNFFEIPQFDGPGAGLGLALTSAAIAYNTELELQLDLFRLAGLTITSVDFFSYQTDTDRLAGFGLTNTDDACVFSVDPVSGNCSGYLYFDNVHPTAQGHALFAQIVEEELSRTYGLQPIPLPAASLLLLSALGGTLLIRRRKTAA